MAQPILELAGICKRFPGVKALDNVSLSVGHGRLLPSSVKMARAKAR